MPSPTATECIRHTENTHLMHFLITAFHIRYSSSLASQLDDGLTFRTLKIQQTDSSGHIQRMRKGAERSPFNTDGDRRHLILCSL